MQIPSDERITFTASCNTRVDFSCVSYTILGNGYRGHVFIVTIIYVLKKTRLNMMDGCFGFFECLKYLSVLVMSVML